MSSANPTHESVTAPDSLKQKPVRKASAKRKVIIADSTSPLSNTAHNRSLREEKPKDLGATGGSAVSTGSALATKRSSKPAYL